MKLTELAVQSASMFVCFFMDLAVGSPWESDKQMHEMSSSNPEIFHLGSQATMWQLIVQSQHVRREETVSIWHEKTRSHPDPTSRAAGSPGVTQRPLTGAFPWWRQEDGQLRSYEVFWRSPSHLHTGANHVLKSRQTRPSLSSPSPLPPPPRPPHPPLCLTRGGGKRLRFLVIDPSREQRQSNPALATVTMCREAPTRFWL